MNGKLITVPMKNHNIGNILNSSYLQYNNTIESSYNDTSTNTNKHDDFRLDKRRVGYNRQNLRNKTEQQCSKSRKQPFFRWEDKYQQHSKDLVDALKTWADSITFFVWII